MNSRKLFQKNADFYWGVALTVAEGLLSGCSYLFIFVVLRMLAENTVSYPALLRVAGLLAAVFLLRLALYGVGYSKVQTGGAAVSKNLRLLLGDKLRRIPLARFTQGQVGQYVNTMTLDVSQYEKILTHSTGDVVKNGTLALLLMGYACTLYLPAGLILLAAGLLLIPELWLSFLVVRRYGTRKNQVDADTVSSLVEYIDGIQTLRAYGAGGVKNKATTQAMKEYSDVCYQYEAAGIPVSFGYNILCWAQAPLVIAVCMAQWAAGALSGVDFLILSMLPVLLIKLSAAISIEMFSWKNQTISKRKIQRLMAEPEETGTDALLALPAHDIAFQNVRFAYLPGEPVLKGVTFRAKQNCLTAIVGDSGSGKSTILNLIAKYYEPDGGAIFIGGQAIGGVAAERVLEQISMVDQDIFLFRDTVRENIRHARPQASDAEVEAACRAANCDGFIRRLPKGYDTDIGENGNLLSGGERQRLSIARAILKGSPILLLDEATANLDIENELAVKTAISSLLREQKTVLMIAHTLSIVKNADQILVVQDGTIKERGTHRQLLAQRGKYAAMWAAEQSLTQ